MPAANSYSNPSIAGGNREDLMNILTIIEPEGTPITSMIKKGGKPGASYFEWIADTLRAPRTSGVPEGTDVSNFSNKSVNRARFGNYIQIVEDSYAVTDVETMVEVAATSDLYAEAKAKATREHKRDLESIVAGTQDMTALAAGVAGVTRGLGSWIQATAQSTNPVPAAFLTPSASISTAGASVTEAQFNNIVQSLFENWGDKKTYTLVAGTDIIEAVDNFTRVQPSSTNQRYQVFEQAGKKEISLEVKVFSSSFGTVNMVPTMFNAVSNGVGTSTTSYFLVPELLELKFLDNTHTTDLPDYGGGPRGFIKSIFGLVCKNPKGLAKLTA